MVLPLTLRKSAPESLAEAYEDYFRIGKSFCDLLCNGDRGTYVSDGSSAGKNNAHNSSYFVIFAYLEKDRIIPDSKNSIISDDPP